MTMCTLYIYFLPVHSSTIAMKCGKQNIVEMESMKKLISQSVCDTACITSFKLVKLSCMPYIKGQ